MDNYFTSFSLFRYLENQKIFACGTVNMSKINLLKNLKSEKTIKREEFDWVSS